MVLMIDVKQGKERYLLKQGALSEAKEMREKYNNVDRK